MTNSMMDAALECAKLGWKVIPIKPNEKRPLIASWQKKCSDDGAVIEGWWKKTPTANLGVVTGEVSGLFVVDVDCKPEKNGLETLEKLEKVFGKFSTLRSKTRSGGYHLLFKYPEGASKNQVGGLTGIDIRSNGGQIVVAPSSIDGSSYEWMNWGAEPQVIPAALLVILKHGDSFIPPIGTGDGQRDDTIFKYACKLCSAEISEDIILELVLKAAELCNPPFDPAEARKCFESAKKQIAKSNEAFDPEKNEITSSTRCPSGFKLTSQGVYCFNEDGIPEWVSSPIMVTGLTRDEYSENWGRYLILKDRDGVEKKWAMPMELLKGDGGEIFGTLYNYGAEITTIRKNRQSLLYYIQASKAEKTYLCTRQVGWYKGQFVLPEANIGTEGKDPVILQSSNASYETYKSSGTLAEWQQKVASLCEGQSRLVFSLACAFTAPLLHPLNEESGGVHLRGDSSIGKTTALRIAASVWGGGSPKDYILTWRATSNGLESVAEAHCDTLLVLDEISQVDSKDAGAITYMLANEQGKTRASRDATLRRQARWRTFLLSSGEVSLANKVSETNQKVNSGMETRLADLPANAGKEHGLFDFIPAFFTDADAFARHLKQQATTYYGTASNEFLTKFIADKDASLKFVQQTRYDIAAEITPISADGQVKRVAGRFALVAAAGELAIKLEVLPFEKGEAIKAAKTCFSDWLQERGGLASGEFTRAVTRLAGFIERSKNSKFENWEFIDGDRVVIECAGYKKSNAEGHSEYFMITSAYSEVLKGFDLKTINKLFVKEGILIPDKSGRGSRSMAVRGQRPQRLYHITSKIHDFAEGYIVKDEPSRDQAQLQLIPSV